MNKRPFLPILCFLLLVSLLAVPVFAATVTCPDSCSCMLPADAKKSGSPGYCSGKQAVCGYDTQKNEKYCFEKTVAKTTTTAPQLSSVVKLPVTTTPKTLPLVAGPTRIVPVTCPGTCACMPEEKAALTAVPLTLCGGAKTWCDSTAAGVPMYCYTVPETVTPTTAVPSLATRTEPCTSGCTCLSSDKADAAGLKRCPAAATLPCDFDPAGRPMQCYIPDQATKVSTAPATTTQTPVPAGGGSVPISRPITSGATAPAQSGSLFEAISGFFSGLFRPRTASEGVISPTFEGTLPPAGMSDSCESRYGMTSCSGQCANLQTDRENCGKCGLACYADEICCSGRCVANTSAANCGGCGNTCPAGSVCQEGRCDAWGCYFGTTNCNGACTGLQTSVTNCGSCGNVCPSDSRCRNGVCEVCPAGTKRCGDRCVSPDTERMNCGSCRNACPDNEICSAGNCIACSGGTTRCGNACLDLKTDNANCGTCGYPCPAGSTCVNGECGCPVAGQRYCIYSHSCADLRTDRMNCGVCGNRCSSDEACCNGVCANINTDADNCGGCGIDCGGGSTGARFCDRQVCASCPFGTYRCGHGADAACRDVQSDTENCGACGNRCAAGEICCGGTCYDPQSSERHCGACMNTCGSAQQCCDGTCTNIFTDDNCSGCGHRCSRPDRSHCYSGRCCDLAGIQCL